MTERERVFYWARVTGVDRTTGRRFCSCMKVEISTLHNRESACAVKSDSPVWFALGQTLRWTLHRIWIYGWDFKSFGYEQALKRVAVLQAEREQQHERGGP